MEGSIRRFLITYRTSVHLRFNRKSPAEVLMGRTIRTISHAMLPRTTSSKSEKLLKRVTFKVGDPILARDFRPGQTWTAGTVVGRRGSVLYEVQVNSEIWIRHRNQLKHGHVKNSTAPSMPWSLLLDTFRLPTQEKPRASESPQQQSTQRPKRTRKQPRRLQVKPNLKSYEESAA